MAAELVKKLEAASLAYYETDKPIMTDAQYDELLEKLRSLKPDHKFFSRPGPQPSRGRVELPCSMPSLKKIKPDSWTSWKRDGPFVISEKLDGISALWGSNGSLYLRGDGLIGQNVSHVVPRIKGLISKMGHILVRGELIARTADVKDTLPRNWTNGILHQDEPKAADLAKIRFIAYEVIEPRGLSRQQQFDWLTNQGFETAWHKMVPNLTLEDLSAAFKDRKVNSIYSCDGLVIGTNLVSHHDKTSAREPDDVVAYKEVTEDQCKETTVLEVEWNASKTGTYIPRLRLEPVLIGSASIQYCTAFNARFVEENKIGKGTVLILRRSGDVIPTIDRFIKTGAKADMPADGTWTWDDTKTHARVKDAASNVSVMAKGLVHTLTSLGIQGFREASALTLCEAGINSLSLLLKTDKTVLQGLLGNVVGERLIDSLRVAVVNASEDVWISAAPCWPKGYSKTKLLAVYSVEPDVNKWSSQNIKGISPDGMEVIKNAVPDYLKWRESLGNRIISVSVAPLETRGSVCLTGFRDVALIARLESAGYSVSDSVTRATLALFVNDISKTSGKIQSAKKYGIKIISRENADSFFV